MPPGIGYTDPMQAVAGAGTEDVSSTQMQELADTLPPNVWEKVRAHVATLPAEQREQWFKDFTARHGAGRVDAQDAMTRADTLRVDQPGMTDTGRGFQMSASPLAHIGAGMQNYQAQKQFKEGQANLAAANQGMAGQSQMGAEARLNLPPNQPPNQPASVPSTTPRGPAGRGAAPGGGGVDMAEIIRMMAQNPAMRNR